MKRKVTIQYRCEQCMSKRVKLKVPSRKRSMDVLLWVEGVVIPRIAKDHRRRNEFCQSEIMSELMLPAPADGVIGEKDAAGEDEV